MNAMLNMLIANVAGSWWTSAIGGSLIWENAAKVMARLAKGEPLSVLVWTPEFQALGAGIIALFAKDPHK